MDSLTLANGTQTFIQGVPSKGACQWLNFYRNVNLTADAGAGGYVYHVIRKRKGTIVAIPGFESSNVTGVIFRYYLYRPLPDTRSNAAIEALYKEGKTNAATLGITGTFAPLYADEEITTTPVGRLMVCKHHADPHARRVAEQWQQTVISRWLRQFCGRKGILSRLISSVRFPKTMPEIPAHQTRSMISAQ